MTWGRAGVNPNAKIITEVRTAAASTLWGMTEQDASAVRAVAARARDAAAQLAPLPRAAKDAALHAMADALVDATDTVLAANAADLDAGRAAGTSAALLDRLALDADRVAAMADGLRDVAGLPDPVGEVVRGYTRPNGLEIRQLRVPFGVVAIVYEARPNVTVDAAGLTLKSGNAVLLRGSASAHRSNEALVDVLAAAAEKAGLPRDAVQLVPGHGAVHGRRAHPRARSGRPGDPARGRRADRARRRARHRPGHRDRRRQRPRLRRRVRRPGHGRADRPQLEGQPAERLQRRRDGPGAPRQSPTRSCRDSRARWPTPASRCTATRRSPRTARAAATEEDWAAEYLSLDLAARVVDDLDEAHRAHPAVVLRPHRGDRHP